MTIWEDTECPICGADLPTDGTESTMDTWWADHEHTDSVVVVRDGWHGQYLAPTLVLDVHDLTDKVPADVRTIAERWLGSMGPDAPIEEVSGNDADVVLDFVTYHADDLLDGAGYVLDSEDGYTIYQRTVTEGE